MSTKKIHMLANPASPHLKCWLDLIPVDTGVVVWNLGETPNLYNERIICKKIPTYFRCLPKVICYLILGVIVRFNLKKDEWVHAHNTSGYGMAALFSGRRYVVTTFGSEVINIDKKGELYATLISQILNRAKYVTTSSQQMGAIVRDILKPEGAKISTFFPGVSPLFLKDNTTNFDASEKVWLSSRRVLPLYHIKEIVTAFSRFIDEGGTGRLVILKGDANDEYFGDVKALVDNAKNISIIEDFLDSRGMADLLSASTFSISIPKTDQLSASIIEAMFKGVIPILGDISAYDEIRDIGIFVDISGDIGDNLTKMFHATGGADSAELAKISDRCRAVVGQKYSQTNGCAHYKVIIEEMNNNE